MAQIRSLPSLVSMVGAPARPLDTQSDAQNLWGAGAWRIAVILPCYNEESCVADTVRAFAEALPEAIIYVYDNNSQDSTVARAAEAGAVVRRARLQGKGNVVRLMFADVEADVYILADGDGTYDAKVAPRMVELLLAEGLDMVSGARVADESAAYRPGHRWGNKLLSGLVRKGFGAGFRDMLSGYRVFSRRFVKSFPAASQGFEIETELTVHALQMRLACQEVETRYAVRSEGSESKLNTISDGLRILKMIGLLLREERPLQFFGAVGAVAFVLSAILAFRVAVEYLNTGLVPHFPSLIVAAALSMIGLLSVVCGLILDSTARARLEHRRFAYLAIPALRAREAVA